MSDAIRSAEALIMAPRAPLPAQASAPIMVAAGEAWGVTVAELLGPGSARQVAAARFAAAALIRRRLGYSTPRIGRLLRRDHSTIVHALSRAAALEAADADFAARMSRAVATLDTQGDA
jgi:chromosomal replication initiation ATPase DnaA